MSLLHTWRFPLPRTHTGILLGNSRLGAIVWGEGSVLRITLSRADLWDHRGGIELDERHAFSNVRRLAEAGDERLRTLFDAPAREGEPSKPSILPVGRFELDLTPARLRLGRLHAQEGRVEIEVEESGTPRTLELAMDPEAHRLHLRAPEGMELPAPTTVPAWEYVGEALAAVGFRPPAPLAGEAAGWIQERPADPPFAAGAKAEGREAAFSIETGADPDAARAAVLGSLANAHAEGAEGTFTRAAAWWSAYWSDVPQIDLPDERLGFLYRYGMYKFGAMTSPAGVPAGLQGPWIEEYQMPPWSADYHFDINVEMTYAPAYRAGKLAHLLPLFRMIHGWSDRLRENARTVFGVEDGRFLTAAVDDRATAVGGWWPCHMDHGNGLWVAQMMGLYYRYTGDTGFLREIAFPFLRGVLRVAAAMLERDGEELALPLAISPEYCDDRCDAWGRNPSFQLAAIHRTLEDLLLACEALGEEVDPEWIGIRDRLPRACLVGGTLSGGARQTRIAIWEGQDLEESHRHHSHLGGLVPFDIFDIRDPQTRVLLNCTFWRWIQKGPGKWTGWCIPWASILHTAAGNAEMAEMLLQIWDRFYVNEGEGTLHDPHHAGFSIMGQHGWEGIAPRKAEFMQIEAGMGMVWAMQEMLLYANRGVHYLFRGTPKRWNSCAFRRMHAEGGFLIDARREAGGVRSVGVESLRGGTFRLANPWGDGTARLRRGGAEETLAGEVLHLDLAQGERVDLLPPADA